MTSRSLVPGKQPNRSYSLCQRQIEGEWPYCLRGQSCPRLLAVITELNARRRQCPKRRSIGHPCIWTHLPGLILAQIGMTSQSNIHLRLRVGPDAQDELVHVHARGDREIDPVGLRFSFRRTITVEGTNRSNTPSTWQEHIECFAVGIVWIDIARHAC